MPFGYGKFGSSYFKKNPNSRYGYNVGRKNAMSFKSANRAYRKNVIDRIPRNPLVRYLQPEKKYFDLNNQQFASNTGWTYLQSAGSEGLTCPLVGSGFNQRVGIKVQCLSLLVRGSLIYNAQPQIITNLHSDHDTVRMVMVVDKQNNLQNTTGLTVFNISSTDSFIISLSKFDSIR